MFLNIIKKYQSLSIQIRATIWFLFCSILQKGISVITTPIFTRLLSVSEYGEYNVFNSWLGIVTVFVCLQMYYGVYTQGLVKFEEERKQFSSALQGLTFSLVCVWTIIYLIIKDTINNLLSLTTVQMLGMFLLIWSTSIFNFWAAEQRVDYKYKNLVIITIITTILKPVIGIVLVINCDDKVTARIWGLAIVEFFCYLCLFISQMKRGKVFYSKRIWKYALGFSIPLIPHYLSQTVLSSSDRIMIKKLVGSEEAGMYALAYSISLLMTLVNTAVLQTLSPWVYKKIKHKQAPQIRKVIYVALIIIASANLLLILCAPEIIKVFAPDEYADSLFCIPPIAMSVFFIFMYSLYSYFEFYFEKKFCIVISTAFAAIVNIALNYIGINMFGYKAAAYTTLICYNIYAFMHYLFMKSICKQYDVGGTPYNGKTLMCISISFMTLGFVLMLIYNHIVLRYSIALLFFILLFLFRKRLSNIFKYIKET